MNPSSSSEPAPPGSIAGSPSRSVLVVVEDDRTTSSALKRIFTRLGWDVWTASTVAGGLELLPLRPRGLILDLMLPDGDGLTVLRQVRAENLTTRVAVTTGVVDSVWLEAVRELEPDGLLSKPVEFDILLQVIGPIPG